MTAGAGVLLSGAGAVLRLGHKCIANVSSAGKIMQVTTDVLASSAWVWVFRVFEVSAVE